MAVIFSENFVYEVGSYFNRWTWVECQQIDGDLYDGALKIEQGIGCAGDPVAHAIGYWPVYQNSMVQRVSCATVLPQIAVRLQLAAFATAAWDGDWNAVVRDEGDTVITLNTTGAYYECDNTLPPGDTNCTWRASLYLTSTGVLVWSSYNPDHVVQVSSAAGVFPMDGHFHGLQVVVNWTAEDTYEMSVLVDNVVALTCNDTWGGWYGWPTWGCGFMHFEGTPLVFTAINGIYAVGVHLTHYPKYNGDCPGNTWEAGTGGMSGGTAISLVEIDDSSAVVDWPACTGAATLGRYSFWSPALVTGITYDVATARMTITGTNFKYFPGDAAHSATVRSLKDPEGTEVAFAVVSQSATQFVLGSLNPPYHDGRYCAWVRNPCREVTGHGEGGV